MINVIAILVFFIVSLSIFAQGTIKTKCYNLLEYPSVKPPNREAVLSDIVNDYGLDFFMVSDN
ncbi:hypothetical protein [Aequorivita marina]|uniref:hypothetical protein n=1 Tax=Aequorivita marina TaxID=3073654 RepID=UPI0028763E6E|nr:hypothetical protein [Aequorivita sp. S2608]MDS1298642.1 hypothetical protein [Aequorivita sp. S2608]